MQLEHNRLARTGKLPVKLSVTYTNTNIPGLFSQGESVFNGIFLSITIDQAERPALGGGRLFSRLPF
jgi:hypothetical protein